MTQALTDAQLDAILDADAADNPDNQFKLFARIQERKRKRAHAKAKERQARLGVRGEKYHDGLLAVLRAEFLRPLGPDDHESGSGALDQLLLTVKDTLDAGDLEDALHAMLRVVRKTWAWNGVHLGPIEGLPVIPESGGKR